MEVIALLYVWVMQIVKQVARVVVVFLSVMIMQTVSFLVVVASVIQSVKPMGLVKISEN